jgi:hypothetical protein
MSKMGDLHAATASDRADEAEREARRLREAIDRLTRAVETVVSNYETVAFDHDEEQQQADRLSRAIWGMVEAAHIAREAAGLGMDAIPEIDNAVTMSRGGHPPG